MKVAVATPKISHFEVPLFRVLNAMPGIETCVFHSDPMKSERYDAAYSQNISWGGDISSGYENRYLRDARSLSESIWSWAPDVVLQYGYAWRGGIGLALQAKRRGIRVVHRGLLSPFIDPRTPLTSRLWRLVRPSILRQFDAHHYGGTYSKLVLNRARIADSDCYFVPFSVDSEHFGRTADDPTSKEEALSLRARLNWSIDDPVVLLIGQQIWVKGPDIMVRAVAAAQQRLPRLKLLMVGSGPMNEALQQSAELTLALGSWHSVGYVPSMQTVPYYLAADLVVFPSRYDTWSRAVNEAMLCRRPCLLSHFVAASGGLVVEGENGMVIGNLDPTVYASRIVEFFSRPSDERREMGMRARAKAFEFSYEAQTEPLRRSLMGSVLWE